MNCCQVKDVLLTDFIDGRLSSSEQKKVETHLSACPSCSALLMAARQVDNDIKALPVFDQAPAHIWGRVSAKIDEPVPFWQGLFGRSGYSQPVYGSVVAGLLVILVVVGPVLSHRNSTIAKADVDVVMQLVYADDDNSLSELEQSGMIDAGLL
jgi:anti-sigma factor RsiW